MIRNILVLLIAVVMSLSFYANAYANSVNVIVNGDLINFPDAKAYINEDRRTMVPIRFISEQLGADVKWDAAANSAVIIYKNKNISIPVNKKVALINGNEIALDTNAVIKDTRTMVPLRFVGEALGAKVLFVSSTGTIRISTSDINPTSTFSRNNKYKTAPEMIINQEKQYTAEVKTNRGIFKIKLFDNDAPLTVNNFVFLAEEGFYNGISFHRIVRDFMIQTGDPLGNGTGGPGYRFKDELHSQVPYAPSVVAMANSGPNTNGSQFFICNGNGAKYLNNTPNYTVFGQIIEGMDVIMKISDTPVENNGRGEFSKPLEHVYIESINIIVK